MYDKKGFKLLTVKDGIECSGKKDGIYYYCVYNPISDDFDKYIFYDEDTDYSMKIVGNDLGIVDCFISNMNDNGNLYEHYFENMEIEKGTFIKINDISQEKVDYQIVNVDGCY